MYKHLILFFIFFNILFSISFAESNRFYPPSQIISKEAFPIKDLQFLNTKSERTYLISDDGRYVFQGELFDVWNGKKITSVKEMNYFSNRVDFDFMGIKPEKMFALKIGTGEKKAYVFAEPQCSYCHKLAKEIKELSNANNEFSVYFVIVPVVSEKSIQKTRKIFGIAQNDKKKAVECFINDSCDDLDSNIKDEDLNFDSIDYNRLVARVLSINRFPFVVNPSGITKVGMPEEIFFFLRQK